LILSPGFKIRLPSGSVSIAPIPQVRIGFSVSGSEYLYLIFLEADFPFSSIETMVNAVSPGFKFIGLGIIGAKLF
jgi:hypothetical protein